MVRAFFTDSGLSAGLEKANAQLGQLARSGPGASGGLRLAERGLQTLALEAIGIQGPLGRVSEGLLKIGGGGALALGAAAGIGLIAAAYKAAAKPFDDLRTAIDKLDESYGHFLARGHPDLVAQRVALIDARAAVVQLERGGALGKGRGTAGEIELAQQKVNELERLIAAMSNDVGAAAAALQARLNLVTDASLGLAKARIGPHPSETQVESIARQVDHERLARMKDLTAQERTTIENLDAETRARERLNAAILASEQGVTISLSHLSFAQQSMLEGMGVPHLAPGVVSSGSLRVGGPEARGPNAFALMAAGAPAGADRGNLEDVGKKIGDKTGMAVARTLAAAMPSLISAVSRGDTGGFLSAAGSGIEGLSNIKGVSAGAAKDLGIIGLGISLIGGIMSLFSGGGAKVSVETISDRAAKQLRDAQGVPQNVTLYLVDDRGNVTQVMSKIQHEERKDASKRFAA